MDDPKLPQQSRLTPSSPEGELRRFEETVSKLAAQVARLEQRVAGLERGPASVAEAFESKPRLESRFGLTLVNRAGAITLAIGIIFFFKYAVDNKWIGAEARVAIGVCAGVFMLALAEWFRRRDRRSAASANFDEKVFTQGLAGCGLATVFVSLYAAFAYYELIIPLAGWSLLVLVSAFAVVLSIRYASAAIAALGFTGAMLTPMLLHNRATAWWFDFLFLLLASLTVLAIVIKNRWPILIPSLAGLSLLSAAVVLNGGHPHWFAFFCVLLAFVHFAAMRFTRPGDPFSNYAYLTAHGCLLIGGMRAVALWASSNSLPQDRFSFTSALESVLLALYGIFALLYGMLRKMGVDRALGLVLLAIVIVKLYLWDVWQLNKFYRISAFVALGILLLTASYLYSRFRSRPVG